MRRLVWAFAGRTYHIVGNLMSRLNYVVVFYTKTEFKSLRNSQSSTVYEWSLCYSANFESAEILKYPFVVEKISMFDTDIKSCSTFTSQQPRISVLGLTDMHKSPIAR